MNYQRAKIGVMGYDDSPLGYGYAQQSCVTGSSPTLFINIFDIEARLTQVIDDFAIDVFIGEQTELAQFHDFALVVNSTSLRTAAAA